MDRRRFVRLSTMAAGALGLGRNAWPLLAQGGAAKPSFKLSIMLGIVFRPLRLSILEQIRKVAEVGYPAFEFINWWDQDLDAIRAEKERLGLEIACIVGNRGSTAPKVGLVNPEERQGFLQELSRSVEAAKKVGTRALIILTGNEVPNLSRQQQHDNIVEGLRAARPIVEPEKITLLLEPLNTYVDHKGYYLYSTKETFDIVKKVDSPYVKVLYDMYHIQIMEGNIISTLSANINLIGHFHVADVPGRYEPGTGEMNYANIFKRIHELGYNRYVAMEYRPSIDPVITLRAVKKMYDGLVASS